MSSDKPWRQADVAAIVLLEAGTRDAYFTHLQFLQKEFSGAVHASQVVPKQLQPWAMYASSACIKQEDAQTSVHSSGSCLGWNL
jgi:hypothetical protein